ncbi:MAG TPA: FtsQ-type POTRA domain-containing protein [Micromonosporaceae bacterium]|nr:FtsQ-type POTRA domain-containing protein [Micromonosporaceae bacterium]
MTARPGTRHWRLVRAGRDAIPNSVRRFNRRVRQRRLRAAAPWLTLPAAGVLAVVVAWLVLGTSLFGVRQVRVSGAGFVSPAEVVDVAGVPLRTPLARVDTAAVEARVATLAPVERVAVRRDWPGTLVIEVVERTPVAAVPAGPRFLLLDASGSAFGTVDRVPAGLPLVRLATSPDQADATTRAALAVLAALTPQLRTALATLVADAPTRVRLELADGKVIVWGDATENDTKATVATSLLGRPGREIDVSAPDVVTVR